MSVKHPPAKVASVYSLYMDTALTVRQISNETGVPYDTIKMWITKKGWATKKQETNDELQLNADLKRKQIIVKNQAKVMKRHLNAGKAIEDAVIDIAEKSKDDDGKSTLTPRDVSDLGKGLNQSAGVTARIVGIDKSSSVEQVGSGNISLGAGSLIQIGLQPIGPAPDRTQDFPDVIDVTPEEDAPQHFTDFPEI